MILFRYILREMIPPCLLSLAVLTSLLIILQSLRLIDLLINRGLSLASVGKIFLFTLPAFLVMTIPMAVLIASISAFSRLASDAEDVALSATGIGRKHLVLPVLFFSLVLLAVTFPLSISAKPWAGRSMKNLAYDIAKKEVFIALEEGVFNDVLDNLVIYVDSIPSPRDLRGVLIADSRDPDQPRVIIAQRGTLSNSRSRNFLDIHMENGTIEINKSDDDTFREVRFAAYDLKLDLAAAMDRAIATSDNGLDVRDLRHKIEATGDRDGKLSRLLAQSYKNYVFPFAIPFFGLAGVPLGLYSRRSGRLGGFAVGIGIIVLFYLFSIIGDSAVGGHFLPPLAGALFPLFAMGSMAVLLWFLHIRGISLNDRVSSIFAKLRALRNPSE